MTHNTLRGIHEANIGEGTSIKTLARAYGVSADQLGKRLKQWRKDNNAPPKVSVYKFLEAVTKCSGTLDRRPFTPFRHDC